MPVIRIVFLWHMHQPFYKDLVTGEYRLPWVRLHALKDYYGMVKLLDEFPEVHQTFNLVPSLITQIEDYVAGTAKDPFLEVASKPAEDLSGTEKRFALQYLFQANPDNLIGRYPRYRELYDRFATFGFDAAQAAPDFSEQDLADLQVLSQIAWFDEYFVDGPTADPRISALIAKSSGFTADDQRVVMEVEAKILAEVLPAYRAAAQRGSAEISTSPFYHPILPLLCDSGQGAVSSPGLPLPRPFQHPEDAAEQIKRALDLHERVFGKRPQGMWPSEGSVSDEVMSIATKQGIRWMATDEGVLGRSQRIYFDRSREGKLHDSVAAQLYNLYHIQGSDKPMHMVFRDHSLSDLIGFVYAGMNANDAAHHFIGQIKQSAASVIDQGKDAVVSVILDGENAWEYFPKSGREFLRRLYQSITDDPELEAVTVSEAIARHQSNSFGALTSLVPGSWINSNFNVWIGAPEDNRSWDALSDARDFYATHAPDAPQGQRALAHEELLIAEGSDWNWWYGPEHHSANDEDFDALYRRHLSNIYQALGATPPEYLAQPLATFRAEAHFHPQTGYIHPKLDGKGTGYFDWLGAAHYVTDHRNAAMHGKAFLLDSAYLGMDHDNFYARIDFSGDPMLRGDDEELSGDFGVVLVVDVPAQNAEIRLDIKVEGGKMVTWQRSDAPEKIDGIEVVLGKVLELQLPFDLLNAQPNDELRLRCSIWKNNLPLGALPAEGAIAVTRVTERELATAARSEQWRV
jgi:alpha-amylase/alpha-mannosidase (GH57 family)